MTCAGRDFNGIGNHFEGAVGCEVEDIAVTFRETVFIARRLNAENSLEISFSGGRVGAGEVQDGSPFRDGDAGREFAARKGNGVVVSFDSVLNFFKGVGGLVVGIAITRDVDNLEMLKNFVNTVVSMQEHIDNDIIHWTAIEKSEYKNLLNLVRNAIAKMESNISQYQLDTSSNYVSHNQYNDLDTNVQQHIANSYVHIFPHN